jgi:hypothetical protein
VQGVHDLPEWRSAGGIVQVDVRPEPAIQKRHPRVESGNSLPPVAESVTVSAVNDLVVRPELRQR